MPLTPTSATSSWAFLLPLPVDGFALFSSQERSERRRLKRERRTQSAQFVNTSVDGIDDACATFCEQWTLGCSINLRLRWEYFTSEEEARARLNRTLWSRVLFDPGGVPIKIYPGFFDPRAAGVAALLAARRADSLTFMASGPQRTSSNPLHDRARRQEVLGAIEEGEAPFIPRERGPVVRRAVQKLQEAAGRWSVESRRSVVDRASKHHTLSFFDVDQSPGVRGLVALTIDDAPCRLGKKSSMMPEVLAALEERGARATFMVMGRFVDGNERDLEEALHRGHELGNHGLVDKPYDRKDGEGEFAEALDECTSRIQELQRRAGVAEEVRWFRAPWARYSKGMAEIVQERGMRHVLCDTYACCPVIQDGTFIGDYLASNATDGSIIVLHMPERGFREWCYEGLTGFLAGLEARGMRAVTVSELAASAEASQRPGDADGSEASVEATVFYGSHDIVEDYYSIPHQRQGEIRSPEHMSCEAAGVLDESHHRQGEDVCSEEVSSEATGVLDGSHQRPGESACSEQVSCEAASVSDGSHHMQGESACSEQVSSEATGGLT